jgi:hypothetical protein
MVDGRDMEGAGQKQAVTVRPFTGLGLKQGPVNYKSGMLAI